MTEYKSVNLASVFRHGGLEVTSLDYSLGSELRGAVVVHVRGTCTGAAFAGCLTLTEGRDVPVYDLRAFNAPLDLGELAVAVDLILGDNASDVSNEIRRICDGGEDNADYRRNH